MLQGSVYSMQLYFSVIRHILSVEPLRGMFIYEDNRGREAQVVYRVGERGSDVTAVGW
jgi:hypothetical protein